MSIMFKRILYKIKEEDHWLSLMMRQHKYKMLGDLIVFEEIDKKYKITEEGKIFELKGNLDV